MADVGTLQRLPRVVGNQSWARDLVYTARKVSAEEAFKFGLVRYGYNIGVASLHPSLHDHTVVCIQIKMKQFPMPSKWPKTLLVKAQWQFKGQRLT